MKEDDTTIPNPFTESKSRDGEQSYGDLKSDQSEASISIEYAHIWASLETESNFVIYEAIRFGPTVIYSLDKWVNE
jgi:hypothetical protein